MIQGEQKTEIVLRGSFEWKIPVNYISTLSTRHAIVSPKFRSRSGDKTASWRLHFFPKGATEYINSKGYSSLLLKYDDLARKCKASYKLELMETCGKPRASCTGKNVFTSDLDQSFNGEFEFKKKLLKKKYITSDDYIIIQCSKLKILYVKDDLTKLEKPDPSIFEHTDCSDLVILSDFNWEIPTVLLSNIKAGKSVKSPNFMIRTPTGVSTWRLIMYPDGHDKSSEGWVVIFLDYLGEVEINATIQVKLVNHLKSVESKYGFQGVNYKFLPRTSHTCGVLLQKSQLFDNRNGFLKNDLVTVQIFGFNPRKDKK